MPSGTTLTWRGGWPPLTWLALGPGILLLAAAIKFQQPWLCTVGGLLAGAGIAALIKRRMPSGEVSRTGTGIEAADGSRIEFSEITRISDPNGVRCVHSGESRWVDCWIEGTDGTQIRVPKEAGPERREWISSLSRWLEPVPPALPVTLQAIWNEEAERSTAAQLWGAAVVLPEILRKRARPSRTWEALGATAGGLAGAGMAKLTGMAGSAGFAFLIFPAFAAVLGLLISRFRQASGLRGHSGGLVFSPSGLHISIGGKEHRAEWTQVRGISRRGAFLSLTLSDGEIVLPPVFSEQAAEIERRIQRFAPGLSSR